MNDLFMDPTKAYAIYVTGFVLLCYVASRFLSRVTQKIEADNRRDPF